MVDVLTNFCGNVYCFPYVLFGDAWKGNQTQFFDGFFGLEKGCLVHPNAREQ